MPLTKKAKTLRFEQTRVFFRFCVAKSNPRGNSFDGRFGLWYSKSGNAQARLVVSTDIFKVALRVCKLGRLYFLLFIFTFKVGKSYENSVNHGGNTSYQPHDKINCHTYASFNLVFQFSLVEWGDQTA